MSNLNAIVVSFPNTHGDHGRYELLDQRTYFSKFECGVRYIFEHALAAVVSGNTVKYSEICSDIFDNYYDRLFSENTGSLLAYHMDRDEFRTRVADILYYARSSMEVLGKVTHFENVHQIKENSKYDTGSFLLS